MSRDVNRGLVKMNLGQISSISHALIKRVQCKRTLKRNACQKRRGPPCASWEIPGSLSSESH